MAKTLVSNRQYMNNEIHKLLFTSVAIFMLRSESFQITLVFSYDIASRRTGNILFGLSRGLFMKYTFPMSQNRFPARLLFLQHQNNGHIYQTRRGTRLERTYNASNYRNRRTIQ